MLLFVLFVFVSSCKISNFKSQDFTIDGQIKDHCTKEDVRESFREKCLAIRGESTAVPPPPSHEHEHAQISHDKKIKTSVHLLAFSLRRISETNAF